MSDGDFMSLDKGLSDPWVLTATLNTTSHKRTRVHPDPTLVFPWYLHFSSPFPLSLLVTWNMVQGNHSCSVSSDLRLLIVKHKCNAGCLSFHLPILDRNYPLTKRVFFLPSFPRTFLKYSLCPLGVGVQWPPALVQHPAFFTACYEWVFEITWEITGKSISESQV